MTNTEAVQNTLDAVEKELRAKLIACAETNDYEGAVLDSNYKTMGESFRGGLCSRWLNVLRLKSMLASKKVDYLWVCVELSQQDMETLKAVHKAMPEYLRIIKNVINILILIQTD
jgi:hypothetical protein